MRHATHSAAERLYTIGAASNMQSSSNIQSQQSHIAHDCALKLLPRYYALPDLFLFLLAALQQQWKLVFVFLKVQLRQW